MIDASLYVEINQHKKTGLFSWKWADSKRLGGNGFQTFEAAAGSVSKALATRFPGKPVDLSKLTPGEIGMSIINAGESQHQQGRRVIKKMI